MWPRATTSALGIPGLASPRRAGRRIGGSMSLSIPPQAAGAHIKDKAILIRSCGDLWVPNPHIDRRDGLVHRRETADPPASRA